MIETAVPPIPAGFLTEWCETFAEGTEAAPAAFLGPGLVAVSAIVGPRLSVRWGAVHRERCNLWVVNVGQSALARKTTGMSSVRWAARVAEQELGDGLRWYGAKRLSDAQMAVDFDVVSADTARAVAEEKERAKAEDREPLAVGPIARQVPVAWVLALNELASLWGEGLRDWIAATQAFLLQLFDGELSSNTRQTSVPAQETFVAALGNLPPAELADRTTLGLIGSGFVGRWLLLPTPGPVRPISFPALNGGDPLRWLGDRVRHLARLAQGAPRALDVRSLWTPEALELRGVWYDGDWALHNGHDGGDREQNADAELWGRLQATAVKLATLLAVARQAERVTRLEDVRVEVADAAWAQTRVDTSRRMMMGVVHESGGGSSSVLGKVENRVVAFLERAGARSQEAAVSFNRVAKAVKHGDSHGEVIRALEHLISTGTLERADGVTTPRGGAPARVTWLVAD